MMPSRSAPSLQEWEARFEAFLADGAGREPEGGSLPGTGAVSRGIGGAAGRIEDASHGIEHVRRVVRAARTIATEEGARLEVVLPAAWLHDCVVVEKDSPDRARASTLAADAARRFLADAGYPAERLDPIHHAIQAHSFSAGIPPRTIEARVVQDADRLDALGAIGLARCLMVGERMGRPLYDPSDPFCERRAPDDMRSAVDHFFTKLLVLPESMQTAAGKREGERRAAFLRAFLEQLARELGTFPSE